MQRSARIPASLALLCATASCTTFGTNVSGSFRCEGPHGVCAPSMAIDDTALSQIQKADTDEQLAPAGPYRIDDGDPVRTRMASGAGLSQSDQNYRLSVVFPAYTDYAGNVHARKTVTADVGLPGRSANSVEMASRARGQGGSRGLLAAAQSAPLLAQVAALDAPPLPGDVPASGAARAAASALQPAPIDRIKAEVDAKLPSARRPPGAPRQAASFPSPE